MAMTAETMLRVRQHLHTLYEEALSYLAMHGPDDDGLDIEWPYESFFRFGSPEAEELSLTPRQWYRLLLGDDTDWSWEEFRKCADEEWEIAVGLNEGAAEVVVFLDLVGTDNEFSPEEFWSLEHWCDALAVDTPDAHSPLLNEASLWSLGESRSTRSGDA